MMTRQTISIAALCGAVAVVAGAFGEHMLKERLTDGKLSMWKTAVEYQIYHSLALLFVGSCIAARPSRGYVAAAWLFVMGIVLFSGCLFAIALGAPMFLMALVPVGGSCLIAGWIVVAVAGWQARKADQADGP